MNKTASVPHNIGHSLHGYNVDIKIIFIYFIVELFSSTATPTLTEVRTDVVNK